MKKILKNHYGNNSLTSCYKKILLALLILIISTINACGTNSAIVTIPETKNYFIAPDMGVIILKPKVTFELLENEKTCNSEGVKIEEIGQLLLDISEEKIHSIGLHSSALPEVSNANKNGTKTVKESIFAADRLVRFKLNEADLNKLRSVCGMGSKKAVLIQYLRVKVDNEKAWLILGLLETSSSYLRAVIRDCQSGEVLWKNEAFIRKNPNMERGIFEDAIRTMYDNLSVLDGDTMKKPPNAD